MSTPSPKLTHAESAHQANTYIFPGDDCRKYEVGRRLRFARHSEGETILSTFAPGDVVTVLSKNACGMGIDVIREADFVSDMIWPDEVDVLNRKIQ